MNAVEQLLSDIEASRAQHLKDVSRLRQLLTVAENSDSPESCGKYLLDRCDGDYEVVKAYVKSQTHFTESMLKRWLISARIEQLETKGENNGTQKDSSAG